MDYNQLEADLDADRCRLCGGMHEIVFSNKVLRKYDVKYYRCSNCHSLQTDTPLWLDEAYEGSNLSSTDTGAAQRNLHNFSACFLVSKLLKVKNVIDIGGGDGLLCRLLRDHKINCFLKDRYATPTYGQGFTEPDFTKPDLITAFEVVEHFPKPSSDFEELFRYEPRALLLSTTIYANQGQDWWYLAPESGQHVFFYSKIAIKMIADKYKYHVIMSGDFILFVKDPSLLVKLAVRTLLKGKVMRVLKSIISVLPTPGVWEDRLLQLEKSKQRL